MNEKNIYLKLQAVRSKLSQTELKKSGLNKFANFKYFELADFLPTANRLFEEEGLCPIFNLIKITTDGVIEEKAILKIFDGTTFIEFETPSAEANVKGANEIQNLGSKHTYLKRYLYMNALEIAESDAVDATVGNDKPNEKPTNKPLPKITDKQISMIKGLYNEDELKKMLANLKKTIEELSIVEASKMIESRTKNGTSKD